MRTIPETNCLTCGRTIRKKKYCSHPCYSKSLVGKKPKGGGRKGQPAWNMGVPGLSDENHPAWKGNAVGLVALHQWIYRKLGYPPTCEQCGFESDDHRKVQWSNISRTYKRDLSDWQRLCQSCHGKYDRKMKRVDAAGY